MILYRRYPQVFLVQFSGRRSGAIKRPGRFDLILLISNPSLNSRKQIVRDELRKKFTSGKKTSTFLRIMDEFVETNYEDKIQFFSYAEWNSFVSEVIQKLIEGSWSSKELNKTFKSHEENIHLRNTERIDFIESMSHSRID